MKNATLTLGAVLAFGLAAVSPSQVQVIHSGCGNGLIDISLPAPHADYNYEIRGKVAKDTAVLWVLGPEMSTHTHGFDLLGCWVWTLPVVVHQFWVYPINHWNNPMQGISRAVWHQCLVPRSAKGLVYEDQLVAIGFASNHAKIQTSAHRRVTVQ